MHFFKKNTVCHKKRVFLLKHIYYYNFDMRRRISSERESSDFHLKDNQAQNFPRDKRMKSRYEKEKKFILILQKEVIFHRSTLSVHYHCCFNNQNTFLLLTQFFTTKGGNIAIKGANVSGNFIRLWGREKTFKYLDTPGVR